MKNLVIFFTTVLVSTVAISHVAATQEELDWFHHHRHWHYHGGGVRPFPVDPQVQKCLSHSKEFGTCLREIHESFVTRKCALGQDCCHAVQKIDEDCQKTVFGRFRSKFFFSFLKQYCALKHASSPPAEPPQPDHDGSAVGAPPPLSDDGGEAPAPEIADVDQAPAPEIADAEAPAPEIDDTVAPGPEIADVEAPTPEIDDTVAPGPGIADVEAPTPEIDEMVAPGPEIADVEAPAPENDDGTSDGASPPEIDEGAAPSPA